MADGPRDPPDTRAVAANLFTIFWNGSKIDAKFRVSDLSAKLR
jgi:hypothetical protein